MAENIFIDKNLMLDKLYAMLIEQVKSLLNKNDNWLSNLSNLTAVLKQTFDKISWIGFYLYDGEKLYLGPFQGKLACSYIELGKGVCGTSAQKRETVIVPDVNKFPGHIICDADSKSEIVIPIIKDGSLFGVLDIDSYFINSFNEFDKKYLEVIVEYLISVLNI
ncbi:MAG: GAF domain-containing protein [Ignavibacteriaceae bacterium]